MIGGAQLLIGKLTGMRKVLRSVTKEWQSTGKKKALRNTSPLPHRFGPNWNPSRRMSTRWLTSWRKRWQLWRIACLLHHWYTFSTILPFNLLLSFRCVAFAAQAPIILLTARLTYVFTARFHKLVTIPPTVLNSRSTSMLLTEGSSVLRRGLCYDRFYECVFYTCFFSFSFLFPFSDTC